MKPHINIAHEGTLGDDSRVRMSFDENSIAHLMAILTDLYSDPELAVIREYSTNAWDSHLAAGNTDPIEVFRPTALNPLFVVKDHGVGMSLDDITENFSKYGWSSKRDNDDEVGMLGLGCKSALTYTSQFTLVTIKNGLQVTVLVTREADGAGAVQIIDTMPTDEPNGVMVRIPVKNPTQFNERINEFFQFWEPGTVLVNDEEPIRYEPSMVLDPDVWLVHQNQMDCDYVIMGQVAYPVRHPVLPLVPYGRARAVVRVPIGCVDFTPSREGLQMTNRTKETLDDIRRFIVDRVQAEAQADIEASPDHREALVRTEKWRRSFTYTYTYKGQEVPLQFITSKNSTFRWGIRQATDERGQKCQYLRIEEAMKAIYIVGHRGNGMLSQTKQRIKTWAKDQGIDTREHSVVIATPTMIGLPWLNDCIQVDFDTLRKIDLGGTKKDQGEGKYKTLDKWGGIYFTDNLIKSTQVWIQANLKIDRSELMHRLGGDVDCIVVGRNQEDKFKREHPFIPSVQAYLAREVRQYLAGMSPDQHFYMANPYSVDRYNFKYLDPKRIADPQFRALIERLLPLNSRSNGRWYKLVEACRQVGVTVPKTAAKVNLANECAAILIRYPLLADISEYQLRHSNNLGEKYYQYVNALYALSNNQITYLP